MHIGSFDFDNFESFFAVFALVARINGVPLGGMLYVRAEVSCMHGVSRMNAKMFMHTIEVGHLNLAVS